jgi:MFS family permease
MHRRRWHGLALLAGCEFVLVLDVSIINMGLPAIAEGLRLSQTALSWVVNSYVLLFGGLLMLGGRSSDLFGPRRVLLTGLIVFAGASFAGAVAQSGTWLVSARAVQGLAAAFLAPSGLSLLARLFADGSERNRALSIWGAASSLGAPAGAMLGGLLIGTFGWSSVLLVNVPICLIGAAAAVRLLPPDSSIPTRQGYDAGGAVTVTVGILLLVYALLGARNAGVGSATTLLSLVGAGLMIVLFVVTERRAESPLVPLSIFRIPTVAVANAVALLVTAPIYGMAFYLTLYLQRQLGYSPLEAGIAFLPYGAVAILTARAASPAITGLGYKSVLAGGAALLGLSLVLLARVDATSGYVEAVLIPSIPAAAGTSLSLVAVNVAALTGVTTSDTGLAGGLVTTAQQVGGALGLAAMVSLYGVVSTAPMGTAAAVPGFRAAYALGAAFAFAAAAIAWLLLSSATSRAHARRARDQGDPTLVET